MNKAGVASHKDLVVWKKSMALVRKVYQLTKHFPESERFGLASQMRRSAVSIPSNIAEGRVRNGTKEYVHFLHIALGSAMELDTQLEISLGENLVKEVDYNETAELIAEVGKMLSSSISSLNTKH